MIPEWALKRERRRNRRSGVPTKHLRRLGVVRDENTLSVAAQHDDTGPGFIASESAQWPNFFVSGRCHHTVIYTHLLLQSRLG